MRARGGRLAPSHRDRFLRPSVAPKKGSPAAGSSSRRTEASAGMKKRRIVGIRNCRARSPLARRGPPRASGEAWREPGTAFRFSVDQGGRGRPMFARETRGVGWSGPLPLPPTSRGATGSRLRDLRRRKSDWSPGRSFRRSRRRTADAGLPFGRNDVRDGVPLLRADFEEERSRAPRRRSARRPTRSPPLSARPPRAAPSPEAPGRRFRRSRGSVDRRPPRPRPRAPAPKAMARPTLREPPAASARPPSRRMPPDPGEPGAAPAGDHPRSKRSRFITLFHAATKSRTKASRPSSQA